MQTPRCRRLCVMLETLPPPFMPKGRRSHCRALSSPRRGRSPIALHPAGGGRATVWPAHKERVASTYQHVSSSIFCGPPAFRQFARKLHILELYMNFLAMLVSANNVGNLGHKIAAIILKNQFIISFWTIWRPPRLGLLRLLRCCLGRTHVLRHVLRRAVL